MAFESARGAVARCAAWEAYTPTTRAADGASTSDVAHGGPSRARPTFSPYLAHTSQGDPDVEVGLAGRSARPRTAGYLSCRGSDPESPAEDGRRCQPSGSEGGLRGAPPANRGAGAPPGAGVQAPRRPSQGKEVRGNGGPPRRGSEDDRGGRPSPGAGCGPDRGGAKGGTLRDRELRLRLHLRGDARLRSGARAVGTESGRGGNHRPEAHRTCRERHQSRRGRSGGPGSGGGAPGALTLRRG